MDGQDKRKNGFQPEEGLRHEKGNVVPNIFIFESAEKGVTMTQKTITIQNAERNSRPIAMLVQTACMFNSQIIIESGKKAINAKSLMGVMAMGLQNGDTIVVSADGLDEEEACEKVVDYLTA